MFSIIPLFIYLLSEIQVKRTRQRRSTRIRRRRVIDDEGNYYSAIVPTARIIPHAEDENASNDEFEEVSIDGSSSSTATTIAPTPVRSFLPLPSISKTANPPIFMCKPCKIYFPLQSMMDKHMNTMHRTKQQKKIKSILEKLKEKVAGYSKQIDGYYLCNQCHYKAFEKSVITMHVKYKHGNSNSSAAIHTPSVTVSLENNKPQPIESKPQIKRIVVKSPLESQKKPKQLTEEVALCVVAPDIEEIYVKSETEANEQPKVEEVTISPDEIQEEQEFQDEEEKEEEEKEEEEAEKVEEEEEAIMMEPDMSIETEEVEVEAEEVAFETDLVEGDAEMIIGASKDVVDVEPEIVQLEEQIAVMEAEVAEVELALEEIRDIQPAEVIVESGDPIEVEFVDLSEETIEHDPNTTKTDQITNENQPKAKRNTCKTFRCPYCEYEASKRNVVQMHITEQHFEEWQESIIRKEAQISEEAKDGRPKREHFCHYCDFTAVSRNTLNSHTRKKHPGCVQPLKSLRPPPTEYQCDNCEFRSTDRRKMQTHIERRHIAEPRYNCEYCGKRFKVKCDLTSHIRFQHLKTPIVCDVCGKICSNNNSLHVHQKREHYLPSFECHICKRRMVTQENLDEHIVRQHEQRVRYACDICGKSFTQQSKLRQHAMTHTGERPHVCHVCGKAFARRAVFRQHLLIHTGQRPYVCDICAKSFTQKPGLICHRKSHPGEKPPLPVVYIDSILSKYTNKNEEEDDE